MKLTNILKEAEAIKAKKAGTPTKVVKPTTAVKPERVAPIVKPKELEKAVKPAKQKSKEDTKKTSSSSLKLKDLTKKKDLEETSEPEPYWGHKDEPDPYWRSSPKSDIKEAGEDEPGHEAKDQAHKMGLTYKGRGYWQDNSGKTVAKTIQGNLVKLEPDEEPVKHPQEHPAVSPTANPQGQEKPYEPKTTPTMGPKLSPDEGPSGWEQNPKPLQLKSMVPSGAERPNSPEGEAEWDKEFDKPKQAVAQKPKEVPKEKEPYVSARDFHARTNKLLSTMPLDDPIVSADQIKNEIGFEDGLEFAEGGIEFAKEKGDQNLHSYWVGVKEELEGLYADDEAEMQRGADEYEAGKPSPFGPDESMKLSGLVPEAAKLGSGARFKKIAKKAAKKYGKKGGAGAAAAAGIKKYGQKKMTALAQKGKRDAKK